MSVGLEHYLVLSALLFAIGLFGVLSKKNTVAMLLCLEIMLNAVNITLVAFSRFVTPVALTGQVFAIFIMAVAAAEAAVAVAIIMAIFRLRRSVDPTELDSMKR